jgi:glucosamine--fructose-6-phosphate aminotransferase (isomerizing)
MFAEAAEGSRVAADQRLRNEERVSRLGAELRDYRPEVVITCGRGSSDHAATFAKYLIEIRLGLTTASAAPSVSSLYRSRARAQRIVLLAISQSGRSSDLLAVVHATRARGGFTVALVNDADSPLAHAVDAVVPLHAGLEQSVAATKSFLGSLSAILHLVSAWGGDGDLARDLSELPALLDRAWTLDWSRGVDVLRKSHSLYVLGRGLGLGVAQEAALKLKETCGLHAEAFSSAEVRHGPMSLVGPELPILALSQDDETRPELIRTVEDMARLGAPVLAAGGPSAADPLPTIDAPAALQPLLLIQGFYRMAEALARARGLDPDRPPHLYKVTDTV